MITSKLDILVGHLGQILARAISTIIKILNLTVIVCHFGGPFSDVCLKKKFLKFIHVTYFIRLVRLPVCKDWTESWQSNYCFSDCMQLGLGHALTCLSTDEHRIGWISRARILCTGSRTAEQWPLRERPSSSPVIPLGLERSVTIK